MLGSGAVQLDQVIERIKRARCDPIQPTKFKRRKLSVVLYKNRSLPCFDTTLWRRTIKYGIHHGEAILGVLVEKFCCEVQLLFRCDSFPDGRGSRPPLQSGSVQMHQSVFNNGGCTMGEVVAKAWAYFFRNGKFQKTIYKQIDFSGQEFWSNSIHGLSIRE